MASEMAAAAIVLDKISRFLGIAGEANDEVSAYSQVHLSEASRLLLLLKNCTSVDKTTTQSETETLGFD